VVLVSLGSNFAHYKGCCWIGPQRTTFFPRFVKTRTTTSTVETNKHANKQTNKQNKTHTKCTHRKAQHNDLTNPLSCFTEGRQKVDYWDAFNLCCTANMYRPSTKQLSFLQCDKQICSIRQNPKICTVVWLIET
jgi:hypothetical protein